MRISDADILILPGLGNSGPGHWQRRWAERFSTGRVVEQDEWDNPDVRDWTATIVEAVEAADKPGGADRAFAGGVGAGACRGAAAQGQGEGRVPRVAARSRGHGGAARGAELCQCAARPAAVPVAAGRVQQ